VTDEDFLAHPFQCLLAKKVDVPSHPEVREGYPQGLSSIEKVESVKYDVV
jgi:hypothetical protein